MPSGPIRVAFALRSLTFGGAEHDVVQIVTASDPAVLVCTGIVVQHSYPLCPELPIEHPRVPVVYQPGGMSVHPKHVTDVPFAEGLHRITQVADALVVWGVSELAAALPGEYRGIVVVTSKASGAFQEEFLREQALLTRHYVANSARSVEAFPSVLWQRVAVIYPGIDGGRLIPARSRDQLREEWGCQPKDRVVGYLGRIASDKGIESLLESVRLLDAGWRVVCVGRTGVFSEYEARVAELCSRQLAGRGLLLPWTRDVGGVLSALDVLAYPSSDEGFSNTLAEAWRLGIPTVATAGVGALAEPPWAHCAITVPPGATPRELATAISAAFGNRRLKCAARQAVDRLTVARAMEEWQNYLARAVAAPRRPRVMVLVANAVIGGITTWLLTLMRNAPGLDWVCLGVLSDTEHLDVYDEALQEIVAQGCAVFGMGSETEEKVRAGIAAAIRQTRPDVMIQAGVSGLDTRFPETAIPLVAVSHGPGESAWARNVLSHSSRCATRFVAVSRSAVEAFPEHVREQVQIIHNGVEFPTAECLKGATRRNARREMGISDQELAVGFVGRLSPEKDPISLARGIQALPPQYRAVFIGPDCANLLPEIAATTSRFVHLAGRSPQAAAELLPGLDVLVCLSQFESFCLAVAEAWGARVPVVSTRVGIVAELIDRHDVAVIIPSGPSPQVLAGAIRQAIRERHKRVHRCRTLVRRRFSAQRMGAAWQTFLSELVNARTFTSGT
ncbi:MAG: glycosyltransferase [Planctomycetales bacterium]